MSQNAQLLELLQFYADVGVDEAMGDETLDRTKLVAPVLPPAAILPMTSATAPASLSTARTIPATSAPETLTGTIEAVKEASTLAAKAFTIEELKAALSNFNGLPLKRTATQMVFADGTPTAKVMVIGEAPGADEDRAGRPFVSENGQLLDKMLGAIGLSRETNVYITTILNWRTPGNRAPTQGEIDISLPFIQRHIELVKPAVIVYIGGSPAKIMQQTAEPISRLRGKWLEYKSTPALAIFHPEYLMKNPAQKKTAWEDLQMLQVKLKELGVL